jgi:hypothetical protein
MKQREGDILILQSDPYELQKAKLITRAMRDCPNFCVSKNGTVPFAASVYEGSRLAIECYSIYFQEYYHFNPNFAPVDLPRPPVSGNSFSGFLGFAGPAAASAASCSAFSFSFLVGSGWDMAFIDRLIRWAF